MQSETCPLPSVCDLLSSARAALKKNDFEAIAAMLPKVPRPVTREYLLLADEISFALGHLRWTAQAASLLEESYTLEPTHRRASSLAYLFYDASLALVGPLHHGPKEYDRESLRKLFRSWIGEALRLKPDSVKDLYRLGVFEAQVESQHDVPALRAFLAALAAFTDLPAEEQERRGDLRKYATRALYAGGRSALRLNQLPLARKLSFTCIRSDEKGDHVDPIHKLHLAAKVCLATGEYEHAERAARLALDAKGPPRRDYLFGLLARIAFRRGDLKGACAWIEGHVQPHRRDAALWRQLGEIKKNDGDIVGAIGAFESALQRDRGGRHLTLIQIGELQLSQGNLGKAKQAFEQALHFRKKHYDSEDSRAKQGLEEVARLFAERAPKGPGLARAIPEEEKEVHKLQVAQ